MNKLPFESGDSLITEKDGIELTTKILAVCEATGKMMVCFENKGSWQKISDVVERVECGVFKVRKIGLLVNHRECLKMEGSKK